MAHLENIAIANLKPNPYRNLDTYPWVEAKIEALIKSFEDIGVFTGIHARPMGDGTYEKWFGHHRQEAAERMGMTHLNVIVEDATDEQMIKAMAHENGEDFSTDFLIQLNTWEGGIQYLSKISAAFAENLKPLDIARLLGFVRPDETGKHGDRLDDIAQACNASHALIQAGHLNRDDLRGLSVSSALKLTMSMTAQMDQVDKLAKLAGNRATRKDVAKGKSFVAQAGKVTAKRVREGKLASTSIRQEVIANAFNNAAKAAKGDTPLPLLTAFAEALCRTLAKILHDDYANEKLVQIQKALGNITLAEDHAALRKVQFELSELTKRAGIWVNRITPTKDKLVSIGGPSNA